jgi:hypothetical protein
MTVESQGWMLDFQGRVGCPRGFVWVRSWTAITRFRSCIEESICTHLFAAQGPDSMRALPFQCTENVAAEP